MPNITVAIQDTATGRCIEFKEVTAFERSQAGEFFIQYEVPTYFGSEVCEEYLERMRYRVDAVTIE